MNKGKKFLKILVIAAVCLLLLGWIVMSLWNWLVPPLFGAPAITFWQALGLFLLARLLFGGWGGKGCNRRKHHFVEKWAAMSPEDRERFKERMRQKWCSPPRGGSNV